MTFGLKKEGTTALKARNEITTQARLRSKSSLFREMNYCEIWFLFVLTSDWRKMNKDNRFMFQYKSLHYGL
jgi:hypothetical protein